MAKRKTAPLTEELTRELNLLKRRIRTQEKRGYYGYKIPDLPSKITRRFIGKIKGIKAKDIRSASTIFVNIETGERVSKQQKEEQEANKRSESAKRGAQTRRENIEKAYDSFEEEYFPKEQDIKTNNFIRDTLRYFLPSDYFKELIDYLYKSKDNIEFYRCKPAVRYQHEQSRSIFITKVSTIIANSEEDFIYTRLSRLNNLDYLYEQINKALFDSSAEEVFIGRTEVLRLLSGGLLTPEDYKKILNETDDEE